ncbi:hypothetical protein A2U01_0113663, partial [Trifolium medium]|nr:hypothetical protein [Trifolium medium]
HSSMKNGITRKQQGVLSMPTREQFLKMMEDISSTLQGPSTLFRRGPWSAELISSVIFICVVM